MSTDMDLVLACKKLVQKSKHTIVQKWVVAHDDKKKMINHQQSLHLKERTLNVMRKHKCKGRKSVIPIKFKSQPEYGAMLQL